MIDGPFLRIRIVTFRSDLYPNITLRVRFEWTDPSRERSLVRRINRILSHITHEATSMPPFSSIKV